MTGAMRPITRRSLVLSLLIAPMTCLGCGAGGVTIDTKIGEKRSRKMEDLKKRAELKRQATKDKRRSR
jgi:hypothetical protein